MTGRKSLNLELPRNAEGGRLLDLINDRLRQLADSIHYLQGFNGTVQLHGDLDLGGHRLTGLGSPQAGQDAMAMGSADRRYLPGQSSGGSSSGGGSGSSYIAGLAQMLEVTLSASPETITTSITSGPGDLLIVVLNQPGGKQIAWDTMFLGAPVDIDLTASTFTKFIFHGQTDGYWYLAALPLTGNAV